MRILSQEKLGITDLPYESIGISIRNKTSIIAYPSMGSFDDGFWALAVYSDEFKARKAMEMLQKAYSPKIEIKEPIQKGTPKLRSGDWIWSVTKPKVEVLDNFYFQFPNDGEIEV